MEKITKYQILSGLRIGGSLGAFLIAGILMGRGMSRIMDSGSLHQISVDWTALGELVLAAAILLITARVWVMLLGGYILFGALKGVILFANGSFPSRGFSTRVEMLLLVFYCIATLMLMFRFAQNPPTILDRIALTIYLFCLWPAGVKSAFSWWQAVGLIVLLSSWCVFRWRTTRHHHGPAFAKP